MEWVRIVLLSIAILLGLILLILIYNLVLEPFAYEIDVKGKGKLGTLEGKLQLRSLLRFLRINVGYENKSIYYNGSIFWGKFILFSSNADDKKRKDKKKNKDSDKGTEDTGSDSVDGSDTCDRTESGDEEKKSDNRGSEVHSNTYAEEGSGSGIDAKEGIGGKSVVDATDRETVDIPENGFEDDVFEGDEFKDFNPMKVKLTEETPEKKSIFKTINKIKNANLNYAFIIKNVKRIFHAIRVKRFEADCDYSFGAPDTTGKAVGVMSMLPFMYGEKVDMRPDFLAEDVMLDGVLSMKGSVRIISLAVPALKILWEIWRKTK